MPNPKPNKGKPFFKGDPRCGQNPNPPEIRKLALKTRKEALALIGQMLEKPWREILEIFQDPEKTGFEHVIAALVVHTKKGSPRHLTEMLDRLYGKVTEKLEHKVVQPFIIERSNGTQVIMGAEIKEGEEE